MTRHFLSGHLPFSYYSITMPRVTISEPGKTPQPYRFKLERESIHIGRGSENDIIIECGSCSTQHCVMKRVDGGYILKDMGSTNGIKQDDTLMSIIDLYDGMEVFIGDVPLKFRLSDEEIETLTEEEFTTHQKKKLPPVDEHQEDGEDDHDRPTTSSRRASHSHHSEHESGKINESLKTLIILILMILAIALGMTLRHYKQTGDILPIKLMQVK